MMMSFLGIASLAPSAAPGPQPPLLPGFLKQLRGVEPFTYFQTGARPVVSSISTQLSSMTSLIW